MRVLLLISVLFSVQSAMAAESLERVICQRDKAHFENVTEEAPVVFVQNRTKGLLVKFPNSTNYVQFDVNQVLPLMKVISVRGVTKMGTWAWLTVNIESGRDGVYYGHSRLKVQGIGRPSNYDYYCSIQLIDKRS
jgi:hypothetical protein